MRILLGLTGSVASVLYSKLITSLQSIGTVDVILTNNSKTFVSMPTLCDDIEKKNGFLYQDDNEWHWRKPSNQNGSHLSNKWEKGDDVLHITLRNNSSALVIAPCSANTLAKLSNGMADNLLTSVARAWDFNRPIIVVPSMNSDMWHHPITLEHIKKLTSWGYIVIEPQSKMLACNTEGMGAMAEIDLIVETLSEQLRWEFPLKKSYYDKTPNCTGIPLKGHQGSFLHKRKHHIHTGVDLYTDDGASVFAVESGKVISIEPFTGPKDNSPWWEDTDCILIEGASGVICYGEVRVNNYNVSVGSSVKKGMWIANVERVLKEGKERPDIMGHRTSMLHMELYPHGKKEAFREFGNDVLDDWSILRNPTKQLINAKFSPIERLT